MSEKRKDNKGRILKEKASERMGSTSTGTLISVAKDRRFMPLICRSFVRKKRKFRNRLMTVLTMKQDKLQ